ncbi:MAG: phosphate ABC transporter permease PstA [Armatimonadota bacterium]|nr:phosphate ABC transporter permease PstA [Armatimonadota bacterium]
MNGSRKQLIDPRIAEKIAFAGLWAVMVVVAVPVVGIIGYMLYRGAAALSWELVSSVEAGLLPAIAGTAYLVSLTALVAAPIGVGAAIYLSEYARPGPLLRMIRLAIINLAGVPSVVYGLFGLAAFVILFGWDRCLLAGSCTLALLVLPLVISASEEALRQVPQGLREGSLALGASKWQTIRRVVLPNALPGIITGMILSIARAAGETAPILFTAAFYSLSDPFPDSLLDPVIAMPYQLFVMATEEPDVEPATMWATAFVLVALVLGLNLVATVIRSRLRRRRW